MKLDTQADIVIADHALKDCPAGSVSWKFIEDSVRDGELKDYAKYPAGPSARTSRPAGSAQPTKKGRTPFTNEDDRILVEWVLEAEGRGAATRGNELYIGLEEKVLLSYVYLPHTGTLLIDMVLRITGILPSRGATAGSSFIPTSIDQIPVVVCLHRFQAALDLLLGRISQIKDQPYSLGHLICAPHPPVRAWNQKIDLGFKKLDYRPHQQVR